MFCGKPRHATFYGMFPRDPCSSPKAEWQHSDDVNSNNRGYVSQMSKKEEFPNCTGAHRAKSKLLSQRALKLWRQQTLAFPVGLWGLSGRQKLSQPSLLSLITIPPGTTSLFSSSPHAIQLSTLSAQCLDSLASLHKALAVSLFHLCLFPRDSTFQLSNFYIVSWAKRRGGFALMIPPSCERHCLFHIRKTTSGPLLQEIPILPEAGKYNSASGFPFPED